MTTFRALPPALAPYVEKEFWGLWRRESGQNGKLTKVPYQSRRPSEHASSKDPTTWSDFATAQQAYEAGHGDGIVFCLLGSGLTAFDLDDCRNATTGEQPADIYRDPVSPSPPVARHHNDPFVRHVETVGVHPVTGKYVDPTHPNAERRPRAMRYIRMCRCAPKD